MKKNPPIRHGFPTFDVGQPTNDVGQPVTPITCSYCRVTHWVDLPPWAAGIGLRDGTLTRPCPYCFKTSKPRYPEEAHD